MIQRQLSSLLFKRDRYKLLLLIGLTILPACSAPKTRFHGSASKNPAESETQPQSFDRHQEFNKLYEFLQLTEPDSPRILPKPIVKKAMTQEQIIRLFGKPFSKSETSLVYHLSFSRTTETWTESWASLDFENDILTNYHVVTNWGPVK